MTNSDIEKLAEKYFPVQEFQTKGPNYCPVDLNKYSRDKAVAALSEMRELAYLGRIRRACQ